MVDSGYLHDKVLAPPDELILCVNNRLQEPKILKYKHQERESGRKNKQYPLWLGLAAKAFIHV